MTKIVQNSLKTSLEYQNQTSIEEIPTLVQFPETQIYKNVGCKKRQW